jgi:hypothetical protein
MEVEVFLADLECEVLTDLVLVEHATDPKADRRLPLEPAALDATVFAKVYLEHGALTWPGGIDLAPDAMYQRIRESGTSTLAAKNRKVA